MDAGESALAAEAVVSRKLAVATGFCWVFFYFLVGVVPTGAFPAPGMTYILASTSFVLLVGLMSWVALRRSVHPVAVRG